MSSHVRLLLVGNGDPAHVGAHFLQAAESLGVPVQFCDSQAAFGGSPWRRRALWWLAGRRPSRLGAFSADLTGVAYQMRPTHLLATGLAPIDAHALEVLGGLGVRRLNFLTDDPWNPAHRAPWFMAALRHYDHVFSPRRANIPDLQSLGLSATYLPFAYAPHVHFPDPPARDADRARYDADVMFAGGADRDRLRDLTAVIHAGFKVALYGGYWGRYGPTSGSARGMLNPAGLRAATASARISLCLVRRANRDGHSMRTFEIPAMGGCMLVEDTDEHREIFGAPSVAVQYFRTIGEAIDLIRPLLSDAARRDQLAQVARQVITAGRHTYRDRLATALELTRAAA